MTDETLSVLVAGRELGQVERERKRNHLRFRYSESWRTSRAAFALSLSMPLATADHGHAPIEAFLWGLLPNNETILQRWARKFGVSARNPFALIAHVGEDCQGAIQFVLPDRIASLRAEPAVRIQWLDEREIAERLRTLHSDQAAWRTPSDIGQFSLAGAQPKTALFHDGKRFGVPAGRTPTTHILKPPIADLAGQCENEHFCLNLARAVGLPAASSRVERFGDETAIVVERYDRASTASLAVAAAAEAARAAATPGSEQVAVAAAAAARAAALSELAKTQPTLRLHQEDLCQALAVLPTRKYQSEGGPTPEQITALLRTHSGRPHEDVSTFLDALAFNWIVGGSDAHAKNYSLLHGASGRVRLAPLYDIVSALPYFELRKIKLAMKIGGSYRMHEIGEEHWRKTARALGLKEDVVRGRLARLLAGMADAISDVSAQARRDGLTHSSIARLATLLNQNTKRCLRLLAD